MPSPWVPVVFQSCFASVFVSVSVSDYVSVSVLLPAATTFHSHRPAGEYLCDRPARRPVRLASGAFRSMRLCIGAPNANRSSRARGENDDAHRRCLFVDVCDDEFEHGICLFVLQIVHLAVQIVCGGVLVLVLVIVFPQYQCQYRAVVSLALVR